MVIKLAKDKAGTVAEAMSEVVCVIDHDATVDEAASTLTEMGVTGAPIVDGERIVGVMSRTDLIHAGDGEMEVTKIMTTTVYAVRPDDPLTLAVRLMVEQHIHRVIVVNGEGDLHGMLSAMDVLRVIAEQSGPSDNIEYVDLRQRKS